MEEDGIEIIISRRSMAYQLREKLSLPVLALPFTSVDLLYNIKEAASWGQKVLLTVFSGSPAGVEILGEAFGVKLFPGRFHDTASLEKAIIWGKGSGMPGCDRRRA